MRGCTYVLVTWYAGAEQGTHLSLWPIAAALSRWYLLTVVTSFLDCKMQIDAVGLVSIDPSTMEMSPLHGMTREAFSIIIAVASWAAITR